MRLDLLIILTLWKPLEDRGVTNTKSDQVNKNKFHQWLRHKVLTNVYRSYLVPTIDLSTVCWGPPWILRIQANGSLIFFVSFTL